MPVKRRSSSDKKITRSKKTTQNKSKLLLGLTAAQLGILTVLTLTLCATFGLSAGLLIFNFDRLTAPDEVALAAPDTPTSLPAAQPEAEATSPPIAPPTSEPTSSPEPTATPKPAISLPAAQPTPEPSATATYAVAPSFINKDKIADTVQFVEYWRELSLPEQLPINFLTRAQLREQWRVESYEIETLQAVQTAEEFYKAMGLIESEVDFVEAAVDSFNGLVAGYYTPEERAMYIIAESVNMFAQEEMTFAHEYTHALQDYHFDLSRIYNDNASGDQLLATRSLPEGDARFVEDLFASQNIQQDQIDYSVYRYMFQEQPAELEGVSPALGIFTFFPYTAGEYFVISLFLETGSWELVNRAYDNPPISTEQVMHPEKYLAGEQPVPVSIPDLSATLGSEWRNLDQDVLGEAGYLVWLFDQLEQEEVITAAEGWDGDAYSLWVADGDRRLLAAVSVWESQQDATEVLESFSRYVTARENDQSYESMAGGRAWQKEQSVTFVTQANNRILIIVAPETDTLTRVRGQFGGF